MVHLLAALGVPGAGSKSRSLLRAGYRVCRSSVQNILKEELVTPRPTLCPDPIDGSKKTAPATKKVVKARHPLHVVMADITEVRSLFGIFSFRIAVVFDVFSRFPLASKVFLKEPSAQEMSGLVSETVEMFGKVKHFVSDQGACFTGEAFKAALSDLGIKQRFGALGQHGSIALIERFWKTLKGLIRLPLFQPLIKEDLENRLASALASYSHFRPHSALTGATPAELFFGLPQPHLKAVPAPRGRPGDPCPDLQVEIVFLDAERLFPVLLRKAA
ncbi:MAG: DDE-type integrase/transposase/recombinase [Thermoanaerobaculia bacterium]